MLPIRLSAILSEALMDPTGPVVRQALKTLPPTTLETLASEALSTAKGTWEELIVDRVAAFAAGQPGGGQPAVAAYFTTVEDPSSVTWIPFIAALSPTEDIPDLRHTATTVTVVPVNESASVKQEFGDAELVRALDALALLDPPGSEDILRIHLPSRTVTRLTH
ncbi:hypothetical protein [Streptomyces sp. NPDC094468]|uniref:hypothetical protein n=1 Tax=Streptomyces sp. NPDC094468 TaxID=3366066 RepID=UPI0037F743B3